MIRKDFILLFIIFLQCLSLHASEPQEQIKKHVVEKVSQFNDYLSFMTDKRKPLETRKYYSKKALSLFVAEGKEYKADDVVKSGVSVEISDVKLHKVTHTTLVSFLNRLVNLPYQKVSLESSEITSIKVSELSRVDDNTFVCTCVFDQIVSGINDGKIVYKDITQKKVRCYIQAEDNEDGVEYIIKLGDIVVTTIK